MFKDRYQAGELLSKRLLEYKSRDSVVVLAIPRGGVPVGYSLAKSLGLSLDTIITKKIPAPGQEELALGAVGPGGSYVLEKALIERLGLWQEDVDDAMRKAEDKRQEYSEKFRTVHTSLRDKTVVLVDDGAATGSTIEVAVKYLKSRSVKKIIIALPVAPPEIAKKLEGTADEVVILETPLVFNAVGEFYENFSQVSDEEVLKLLQR